MCVFRAGRYWIITGDTYLNYRDKAIYHNISKIIPNKVKFTISFSAFFYSLDVYSLIHRLFKQYRIKNIWSPPGIEPRTTCMAHKRSVTELRQPASELTLQFCIYTVKGYCLQSRSSQQSNEISLYFKDSYSLNFLLL